MKILPFGKGGKTYQWLKYEKEEQQVGKGNRFDPFGCIANKVRFP